MIIELAAVRPGDRPRVGGKAMGCASLRGLGLPVPRGVVLTTRAFDCFFAPFEARRRELLSRHSARAVTSGRCEHAPMR